MNNNGWILAKDRLPEENKLVLVCLKITEAQEEYIVQGYIYAVASYKNGCWFSQDENLRFLYPSHGLWEVVTWLEFTEINYEEV